MALKQFIAGIILALITISCVGTDFISDPVQLFEPKIEVETTSRAIAVGEMVGLSATYYDSLGQAIEMTMFQWSTSDSTIATITGDGTVSGIMQGQVQVVAMASNVSSNPILITVVQDPNQVATVLVSPDSVQAAPGQMVQFNANALNLNGDPVTGQNLTWRSVSPNIATISAMGLASAIAPGVAGIIATVDGIDSAPAFLTVAGQSKSGQFVARPGTSYSVSGLATLEKQDNGDLSLHFDDDFRSSSGPGLYVYLSTSNAVGATSLEVGRLQNTQGEQDYTIQGDIPLDTYSWVIIHCKPFNVTFGYASLQ